MQYQGNQLTCTWFGKDNASWYFPLTLQPSRPVYTNPLQASLVSYNMYVIRIRVWISSSIIFSHIFLYIEFVVALSSRGFRFTDTALGGFETIYRARFFSTHLTNVFNFSKFIINDRIYKRNLYKKIWPTHSDTSIVIYFHCHDMRILICVIVFLC